MSSYDVVIVGSGPNGLTAAAVLAASGLSVLVREGRSTIGGSCRTEALTLPGFAHDVCSAVHPMGVASPAFRALGLVDHGLTWTHAPLALAHPLDDGRAAVLSRVMAETLESIGEDGARWARWLDPFVRRRDAFFSDVLRPVRWPGHPALLARFGLLALRSCTSLAGNFEGAPARALFAGNAAHSFLPLDAPASAAIGLVLSIAGHAFDWPFPRGGSQRIIESLAAIATSAGAVIQVDAPVRTLKDVPVSRAVLLDVTPRQLGAVAGAALSPPYRRQLARYRYGPAAFKVDYALSSPIPWRAPACARAATVHVGGTLEEIARAEAACNDGRVPDAPFVLVAQQSLMDDTRAPRGAHTAWAYCHVPHGATADMTAAIERQIERFAPGFRDVILARHAMPPQALEAYNPNLVGGDIGGGSNAIGQFLFRPFPRWNPYTTSNPAIFLCSASTPPGAGVHGMCGYWAARTALDRVFNRRPPPALTW